MGLWYSPTYDWGMDLKPIGIASKWGCIGKIRHEFDGDVMDQYRQYL